VITIRSGHEGSHTFITHEFITALVTGSKPVVDVYEAVACTAPGIAAHQSALKGGLQMKVPSFARPHYSHRRLRLEILWIDCNEE
jgi:phage tail protein X